MFCYHVAHSLWIIDTNHCGFLLKGLYQEQVRTQYDILSCLFGVISKHSKFLQTGKRIFYQYILCISVLMLHFSLSRLLQPTISGTRKHLLHPIFIHRFIDEPKKYETILYTLLLHPLSSILAVNWVTTSWDVLNP